MPEPSRPLDPCPDAFIELACRLADASGPVIRSHFRTDLEIDRKLDASPVTIADRGAEAAMREILEREAPEHGIHGEEYGIVRGDAQHLWVLDPIDGTQAFMTGLPIFGTLIALAHNGRPWLGVIDQPVMGERWVGAYGQPTRLNGAPAATSGCTDLAEASLYATSPDMFTGSDGDAFARLKDRVRTSRFGGDCYQYGLVASGHVDLVVEAGLATYDYMALAPVVEGAGGVFTDWRGVPMTTESDGRVIAAATPALHRAALAALDGV